MTTTPERSLSPEEEWARVVVEHALDVPVVQHDDNSRDGMYDLAIVYPNGDKGAVEVTAAADPEPIALWRELHRRVGHRWIEPQLAGGWIIAFEPYARAKSVVEKLPRLLHELEQTGTRELRMTYEFQHLPRYASASSLGIRSAFQSPETSYPGSIYWTVEQSAEKTGGFVPLHSEAVAGWVGDFLRDERPNHVAKLARSGCPERHAFVIVPSFADAPLSVSDPLMTGDAPLPTTDPTLPSEVTHVWVAGTWSGGAGFRWSPGARWQRFATEGDSAA